MSDISTKSRFPNLGKLSIALLEHTVKPIIGEKAIDEIKSPVVEKNLINSLEIALEKAEKRFISEYGDKEICEVVLNLPLSDLPSVIQAVRTFCSSPNDPTLGQVLSEQLKISFRNLSSERIDSGVSAYIRFLRDELANLSGDVRDKLSVHATLNIQDNTTRIATTMERILANLAIKDNVQPSLEFKRQISKIVTYTYQFSFTPISSEAEAWEKLKETGRNIFLLLSYAFLDACELNTANDFVFLLSLSVFTAQDGYDKLRINLVCHITPFVNIFEELIDTLFNKSSEEFLMRTSKYPSDLKITLNYKYEDNIPYRITRVGTKAIRIDCIDSNAYIVKFPMQTSDVLVYLSSLINGRAVLFDDIDFSKLQPNEIELMNYPNKDRRSKIDISDFTIDPVNPELWELIAKSIQGVKR